MDRCARALVGDGVLALDDTVSERLPEVPAVWGAVTLYRLFDHTSGLADFTVADGWTKAVFASPGKAPAPTELLSLVEGEPLVSPPGSRYQYSNSDDVGVALMIQAVTGGSYIDVLADKVFGPLGLDDTSLPAGAQMHDPVRHGYGPEADGTLEDQTFVLAAGYTEASVGWCRLRRT